MINQFWIKLFLFTLALSIPTSAQTDKSELSKLSFNQLKELFLKNSNNKSAQYEYATIFLRKALLKKEDIHIARGYYMFSLLETDGRAIDYLDKAIRYSKNNINKDYNFPAQAYSDKAYLLKKDFKFKEAIDNFILAEKYAYKNNIAFYYKVRYSIAVLKSEELGNVDEALPLYKECFYYYKNKNIRDPKYSFAFQDVLFGLADAYKSLGMVDSASHYNKFGCRESAATKDDWYYHLFVLNEGANLVLKKDYLKAIDSIKKALPKIISYKDNGNILAGFYYLGKANQGLGKSQEAAENFNKVDSIYNNTNDISPEFMDGYHFLINFYKERGDEKKQLQITNKLLLIDSVLNKNYKELSKKLQREYDNPHLLSEKESQIKYLRGTKTSSYIVIAILLIVLIIAFIFAVYQRKLKKTYRARFEKIIKENLSPLHDSLPSEQPEGQLLTTYTHTKKDDDFDPLQQITQKTDPHQKSKLVNQIKNQNSVQSCRGDYTVENIGISQEVISQILNHLQLFETNKKFLQSSVTVQNLSLEFETNSKYLSKIVNAYKRKSFVQYVNDLRIETAVVSLQSNKKLRKYTLHALAEEFGFNTAESFSAAFSRKTGIKPSYFIKELEKG